MTATVTAVTQGSAVAALNPAADVLAGHLVPPLPQGAPGSAELGGGAPGYVLQAADFSDEYADPALVVRRLSDGVVVRTLARGSDGGAYEPVLSGRSVVQLVQGAQSSGPTTELLSGIEDDARTGTVSVPSGDRVVSFGEAGLLTRRTTAAGVHLHVLRPDGSDTEVAGDLVSDGATPTAGDARTAVLRDLDHLWELDWATATARLLDGAADWYGQVFLTPTRTWWVHDDRVRGQDVLHWAERGRTGTGTSTVANGAYTSQYVAVGEDLLLLVPPTSGVGTELLPLDRTKGTFGNPVAHSVLATTMTGDGTLALIVSDTPTGRLAVMHLGDAAPGTVAQLPARPTLLTTLALAGPRVVASYGNGYEDQGPIAFFDGGAWSTQLGGSAVPGGLLDAAGDAVLSRLPKTTFEEPGRRITWSTGSRDVTAYTTLGHGGKLLTVPASGRAEVQDLSGRVLASFTDGLLTLADGTTIWHESAGGRSMTGTDTSGQQGVRSFAFPCPPDESFPTDVVGRWAYGHCATTYRPWVVDTLGVLPPWYPDATADARLGNGFLADWHYRTDTGGQLYAVMDVTDLAPGHARRSYGPLHGRTMPPLVDLAVDHSGGKRVAYLDTALQARTVDLGWLAAAPTTRPDTTAPVLTATGGTPRTAPTTTVSLTWRYEDRGQTVEPASGFRDADVRYRQRPAGATAYGAYFAPAALQHTTAGTAQVVAGRGVDTCFSVRGRDVAGNVSAWSAERCSAVDGTVPVLTVADAGPAVMPTTAYSPVRFRYTARDNVAVKSYDVAVRTAAAGGTLGAWHYPSSWQGTAATSQGWALSPGQEACFVVRARDAAGGTSPWASPRCTGVPYDDRALAVHGAAVRTTSGYALAGTVTRLDRAGASVSRGSQRGRRIAVVVVRAPHEGWVEVLAAGHRVGRISLSATTTSRQVVVLPAYAFSGTVVVRSTTSSPSRIDALAVLR